MSGSRWRRALWMLFAARLLAGAGAGNIAAAQAYIADVTPPEKPRQGHGHDRRGLRPGLHHRAGDRRAARGRPSGERRARRGRRSSPPRSPPSRCSSPPGALKESLSPEARGDEARPGRLALAKSAFARPALRRLIVLLFFITTAPSPAWRRPSRCGPRASFGWGPEQVGWVFFYVGIVLVALQGGAHRHAVAPLRRGAARHAGTRRSSALGLLGLAVRRLAVGGAGRHRAAGGRHGAAQSRR